MEIKKIILEKFKKFDYLELNIKNKFSVIIGENNIGKTSIFEALNLWKQCYDLYLTRAKDGFYKAASKYINFNELDFIRLQNDADLFTSGRETKITLIIEYNSKEYKLGFSISKPESISNSYYKCGKMDNDEFLKFTNDMKVQNNRLDKIISIYQSNPISKVIKNEPFMNKGQINSKIHKGKSNEVLRNKIITNYNTNDRLSQLGVRVSSVLGNEVKFHFRNRNNRSEDEYIKLTVESQGREFDLYSQGSGLLQVVEIFATISFMDSKINLLLVDEPDSHIHEKLQKNLFCELKKINECSIMVITHSDAFLSEIKQNELFYLSRNISTENSLIPIDVSNFDIIKNDLGGTIMALEKLSNCNKVVFVEGDDDIEYLQLIYDKYQKYIDTDRFIKNTHLFFRGKDFIETKIPNYVRLTKQLLGRDKPLVIIFDKDFSIKSNADKQKNRLESIMGRGSVAFYHNGYCFESVLFSDSNKLCRFLQKFVNDESVSDFFNSYVEDLKVKYSNIQSPEYRILKESFKGQNGNIQARPELQGIEFDDFLRDSILSPNKKIQDIANKKNIRDFFEKVQSNYGIDLISETLVDDKDDTFVNYIFKKYLSSIESEEDIFDSLKEICTIA